MIIKQIEQYLYGIIDTLRSKDIPRGSMSSCLNWLALGNKIELRRGYTPLGNEGSSGKITGLYRATMATGTEQVFRTRGKKAEHYNIITEVWDEIGTDILGTDADGSKISFAQYKSLAGDQLFFNSPNGPYIKIMLANPLSYSVIYDATKNYKGYIKIKLNRTFLWGRNADKTALYTSKIDNQTYTTVSGENVGTGNGSLKTFTDTLAFRAGGAKRTCFAITATDSVETFKDNNDGTLTGDKGGTGTINYTTGAISLTFNTAPAGAQAITASYQWEDVTVGGIADFTFSATRVASEGDVFRQDDGGILQTVLSFDNAEYCIHEHKTWVVTLSNDDTNATNLIYRNKAGIPARQASVDTEDGIYFMDKGDDKDYEMKLMTYAFNNDKVIPRSISKQHTYKKKQIGIDLSGYRFDRAVMFEWGDFILVACRLSTESINTRMLVYDTKQKSFSVVDYYADEIAEYGGTLIVGDTLLNTVFTCFSGFDDDDSAIPNFVILNEDNLDFEGLKKCVEMVFVGDISPDQKVKISVSIDNGAFVEVGATYDSDGARTAFTIEGGGGYVDLGQRISVGSNTIGERVVGGTTNDVFVYRYMRKFLLGVGKFNTIKTKVECQELGYFSFEEVHYRDIRKKSRRLPQQYVQ